MNGHTKQNNENSDFEFDLSRFTNEEKLSWLGGYNLWNLRAIPGLTTTDCTSSGRISNRSGRSSSRTSLANATSICLSDGPHGLRKPINDFTLQEAHPATCFPSACSSACSWNPELLQTMGRALAKECNYYGVQVLLGPGVNLKRHPCGGRNHEYFSEDPYLAGMLAKSYISGVQESGTVGACIKHFCLNNQESKRFVVDVVVDERTMRELYLPAFEHALCSENKSSVPKLVMGAYNKVNGVYCCENEYLLGSILRGEWKYDGVVVSDWGAILDRKASLRAGMDLEMPGTPTVGAFDLEVLEECESERSAIKQRENDEEQPMVASSNRSNSNSNSELEHSIDACANRVVKLIADLHTSETENSGLNEVLGRDLFDGHDQLAREIATECIVLLQNKENVLPLSRDVIFHKQRPRIGIIGEFAKDSPRYQGMGSAHVTPTKLTTFYDAMGTEVSSVEGGSPTSIPFAKGYHPDEDSDKVDQSLIDEAISVAQQPGMDVLVVCIGLPEIAESEGFDRTHCRLPKQHIALVEALTKVHSNIVVVLSNGGIVEIPQSFVEGTKAILDGFLLGQAGGAALVDVLLGDVSPSGKLPETIPIVPDSDVPSATYFPGTNERVEYREGLDVGYRYYDTVGIPVRFPFGHGLQYTTFEYSNLSVTIEQDEAISKRVRVTLDVTNKTGNPSFSKPVKEVVQLYIKPISSSVYRPNHELKGFSKIEIASGSTETVEFVLDKRAFSYYDIGWRDWVVEEGGFEVRVGTSSRDIRLTEVLEFATGRKPSELATESYPPSIQNANFSMVEQDNQRLVIDDEIFAKRFGNTASTADSSNSKNDLAYQPPGDVSNSLKKNNNVLTTHSSTITITRNTLIVDAAKMSRLGSVLMFVSYMVAKQEVREGPSKTRELRMIRANIENVPLRSLVVFSQGNLTFKTLDVLIHVMNGEYRKALKRLFRRRKQNTTSS